MSKLILIDLDGVLFDLAAAVSMYAGENVEDNKPLFWKTLPEFTMKSGFATLPKMEGADTLVSKLVRLAEKGTTNLAICTSVGDFYLPRSEVVVQKKRALEKNFPELNNIPFITTTSGKSKSSFANLNTFLIDDHPNNIKNFIENGGEGFIWSPTRENFTELFFNLHQLGY